MAEPQDHRIAVHLDELLQANQMTLVELSSRVGVTVANLSILKNSHAKAIRFSTLTAICDALGCTQENSSACNHDRISSMSDSPEGIADAAPGTDILTRTVTGVGSDVSPIK